MSAKIEVVPELYQKLVRDNPSVDTALYLQLTKASFSKNEAKLAAFAGSKIDFVEVSDTSLRVERMAFARAQLTGDTLAIYLSSTPSVLSLLGGYGIALSIVGSESDSRYYEWTDLNPEGSEVEAEYSTLDLSTDIYTVGDTIAGRLFYKSKEFNDGMRGKKRVYASGYFRAIIN